MDLLIGNVFRRNAEHVPEHVAASLGEHTLTHGQLDADANRIAHALRALGIGHGDRVVTWADTSLAVLPLFAALAKLGAVFAPLNARLGADEAADVAALARARLFVADAARAEAGEALARRLGIPHFARLGGERGPGLLLEPEALGGPTTDVDTPELRENDPHVIFFTSGSTGRPKGVVLSHRTNWLRGFQGVFRDAPERSICMFPFFHMGAFTLALTAWHTRGEIGLVEAATAEQILAAVERRRGNRLYCIPAVWARILETPPDAYDTSSLREIDTGTSATPIELIRALKQRFPGTVTRIYYGSTESGSGTTLPDADVLRKPGSAGLPSPSVELRLSGAGEIQLRSPFLMDGYFDDPEASAAGLQGGWYQTGDLGELDDEGYLSVIGRLKEIIRTGGESVAPNEVEAALADHADLAEIAVVGIPDSQWGEVVCAVVVPKPGRKPRLEALQQHCEAKLAGFKKPRRLECVDALPRTAATGQVQRRLLVESIVSA
ncbi:MAG: acyl--CoA ligase [Deltaproteobacteria bacterium]|nr:acyl--CoA ligase [Deltaproteobacteria bacterium]MBW2361295.1 acyl--CoA ligase [Deltaproteobacteria bacterium]